MKKKFPSDADMRRFEKLSKRISKRTEKQIALIRASERLTQYDYNLRVT